MLANKHVVGAGAALWVALIVLADLAGWRIAIGSAPTAPPPQQVTPSPTPSAPPSQPTPATAAQPKAPPSPANPPKPASDIDIYAGQRPTWCDNAQRWVEKYICADPFLAPLDYRMEAAYLSGRSKLAGRQRSDFEAAQYEWLKNWWRTCGLGPAGSGVPADVPGFRRCFVDYYVARIQLLGGESPPPSVVTRAIAGPPAGRSQPRPPPSKQQVAQALIGQNEGFAKCVTANGGLAQILRQYPDGLLRFQYADLDGDGTFEIIAIGDPPCYLGARRPAHWVLKWRNEDLVVILSAGVAESLTMAPQGAKNGMRNLVSTYINGMGTSVWRAIYEFDGQQYKRAACFEVECEQVLKNCRPERRVNCG